MAQLEDLEPRRDGSVYLFDAVFTGDDDCTFRCELHAEDLLTYQATRLALLKWHGVSFYSEEFEGDPAGWSFWVDDLLRPCERLAEGGAS